MVQEVATNNHSEDSAPVEAKPSKSKLKKLKKKAARERRRNELDKLTGTTPFEVEDDDDVVEVKPEHIRPTNTTSTTKREDLVDLDDVTVDYVPEGPLPEMNEPIYRSFLKVFNHFKIEEEEKTDEAETSRTDAQKQEVPTDAFVEKPADKTGTEEAKALSRKKWKRAFRPTVAQLKTVAEHAEVVEMHDVCSHDPYILVHFKGYRNVVPVPRHWLAKSKYLQRKRGIERPPFDPPAFIKATGIMEMREAVQEKDDKKTMKGRMRERTRPKMGKIDIDYQKLHDAFFKYQTKPHLTSYGDLYYEGKEHELRLKEKRPGAISDELRIALGMPVGPNAHKFPPPWLVAMQRYGPPPSYPTLKVPGLNAALPEGCTFGYHPGGWGKPPVDEVGRPLYGDVFGTGASATSGAGSLSGPGGIAFVPGEIVRRHWGELREGGSESEGEEEGEEMEMEDEEDSQKRTDAGAATPAEGLVTPSGVITGGVTPGGTGTVVTSVGLETPESIELRKRRIEAEMEGGEESMPPLYTVLPEKRAGAPAIGAGVVLGTTHLYDVSAAVRPAKPGEQAKSKEKGVEISLQPEELELEPSQIEARYEETVRAQDAGEASTSGTVSDRLRKRKKPDEPKQQQPGTKKHKEFKF